MIIEKERKYQFENEKDFLEAKNTWHFVQDQMTVTYKEDTGTWTFSK